MQICGSKNLHFHPFNMIAWKVNTFTLFLLTLDVVPTSSRSFQHCRRQWEDWWMQHRRGGWMMNGVSHRMTSTPWTDTYSLDLVLSSGRAPPEKGVVRYPGDLLWDRCRCRGLPSVPRGIVSPCRHIANKPGHSHPISVPVQWYQLLHTHRSGGKEVSSHH